MKIKSGSKQKFKLHGRMVATLIKPDGTKLVFKANNLITEVGFDFVADAMCKPASRPDVMSHIAIGTGTTAANAADTELETESARAAATYTHTAGTDTFELEATFGAGVGTGTITEAGVLNDNAAGILLDRVVFGGIVKGASDVLIQRFIFTMSQ